MVESNQIINLNHITTLGANGDISGLAADYDDYDLNTNTKSRLNDHQALLMNNEFYNDDFYDYKDTFLNRSSHKITRNAIGEEIEEDEFDEDQVVFMAGGVGSSEEQEQEQQQHNQQHHQLDQSGQNFDDDAEDLLMMDTFFKRVDSMEMQKLRKAKIVNNYLIGELLGDGSYGKVKECLDLNSLSRRAVKIINLKMIARKIPRGVENVRKEINIMKRLNHKNLIKLYNTFEKSGQPAEPPTQPNPDPLLAQTAQMINLDKPPKLYIFMDYCMTSLEKLLKNAPDQRLRNWQAQHYFKQLMDGLDYLHSINIIHNDIKPGNLLITCDDILKICDFSISAELNLFFEYEYKNGKQQIGEHEDEKEYEDDEINPNLLTHVNTGRNRFPIIQCTPMFQCPEMLDEQIDELAVLKNAPKVDIWSSGVTLYQLTTGQLPFTGQTIHQIFENIRTHTTPIQMPANCSLDKNLSHLLINMLNRDPFKRWSIKQIRDSEWFRKKHPIVKEDLALLSADVIQSEFQTFRMISYLENYCQLTQPATTLPAHLQMSIQQHHLNNHHHSFNNNNNLSVNTTSACCFNDNDSSSKAEIKSSFDSHSVQPNKQGHKQPSSQSNPSQPSSQQLNGKSTIKQATKVKRTHCSLM